MGTTEDRRMAFQFERMEARPETSLSSAVHRSRRFEESSNGAWTQAGRPENAGRGRPTNTLDEWWSWEVGSATMA